MEKNDYKKFCDEISEQKKQIKKIKSEIKNKIDELANEISKIKSKKLITEK